MFCAIAFSSFDEQERKKKQEDSKDPQASSKALQHPRRFRGKGGTLQICPRGSVEAGSPGNGADGAQKVEHRVDQFRKVAIVSPAPVLASVAVIKTHGPTVSYGRRGAIEGG